MKDIPLYLFLLVCGGIIGWILAPTDELVVQDPVVETRTVYLDHYDTVTVAIPTTVRDTVVRTKETTQTVQVRDTVVVSCNDTGQVYTTHYEDSVLTLESNALVCGELLDLDFAYSVQRQHTTTTEIQIREKPPDFQGGIMISHPAGAGGWVGYRRLFAGYTYNVQGAHNIMLGYRLFTK
jgi:hypothetical protein